MHDFKRLQVWQWARELSIEIDGLTRRFPSADRGVVRGQLRRAMLSVPANIAEGCGKSSRKETIRFLQIASGSAREAENHLILATDLGYLRGDKAAELREKLKSVQRMLAGLMRKLPD